MTTAAGWYDAQGRQLLVAQTGVARACFYIGEAVGLLSNWAVSPSSPKKEKRKQKKEGKNDNGKDKREDKEKRQRER